MGVVVNKKDEILLIKQKGDFVSDSFPKGRLGFGGTPMTAAKREIYEESGIDDPETVRELGVYIGEASWMIPVKQKRSSNPSQRSGILPQP